MKTKNLIDVILLMVSGVICKALGGWDFPLSTLAIFILVDVLTGVYIALVLHKSPKTQSGKLSSGVGFHGIMKKFFIFVMVAIMYRIDLLFDIDYLRIGTIVAYLFNEGVSIIENFIIMDIYVPDIVKKGIDLLHEGGENDEDKH